MIVDKKRILAYVALFVMSGLLAALTQADLFRVAETRSALAPSEFSRGFEGPELALIYIGSASCVFSKREDLIQDVRLIKETLRSRASQLGVSFAMIGISIDTDASDGLTHLERFGSHDEIFVGGSWHNAGALKYVWNDFPGKASTPQLVLVERTLDRNASTYRITGEQVRARKAGIAEIKQWLANGVPIPVDVFTTAPTTPPLVTLESGGDS